MSKRSIALARLVVAGIVLLCAGLCATMVLTGCGRSDTAEDSIQSNANGYYCPKCGLKFYTASGVFADKCPECGRLEIEPIWGHVCEKCNKLTLVPRGVEEGVVCGTCGGETSGIEMPKEQDLIDWGAKKYGKDAVSM